MALNPRIALAGLAVGVVLVGTRKGGGTTPWAAPIKYPPAPDNLPQPTYTPTVYAPPEAPATTVYVPPATPQPTLADVIGRVIAAAATGNPASMRTEATLLRSQGYPDQAGDLEELARRTEQLRAVVAPAAPAVVKPAPAPAPAPVVVKPAPAPAPAPVVVKPAPAPAPAPVVVKPAPAATPMSPAPQQPPVKAAPVLVGLKLGASGDSVKAWQQILRDDGFSNVVVDGKFGPETQSATSNMQIDRGLGSTGVVDAALVNLINAPAILKRTLQKGSHGGAVKSWQKVLIASGQHEVLVDGAFEGETVTATKYWQAQRKLTADGIVGPASIAAIGLPGAVASVAPVSTAAVVSAVQQLYTPTFDPSKWRPLMKRGDQGNDVAEWQTVLSRDGFTELPDGKFGPGTEASTRSWQSKHGLTADGIVGANTRAKINLTGPSTSTRVSGFEIAAPAAMPSRQFRAVAPLPGMAPQVPLEQVPRERALASQVAQNLFFAQPGAEDRTLVRLFQEINGLNATGAYGPGTAECLIGYGIVPPKPRAWPSKGVQRVRARYVATLREQARRDPQRRLEWTAAAEAARS